MPDDETQELAPTPLSDWKDEHVVELPSDNVVRVRDARLYYWIKTGQLSKATCDAYRRAADEKAKPLTLDEKIPAVAEVLCKCVVEPPWSVEPRDGARCIDDVSDQDRSWLALRLMVSL